MITIAQTKDLLVKSWNDFNEDQATRLGASLAYYTILSLAPLLMLIISIAGLVLGKEAAQGRLFDKISSMVGSEGGHAIQSMIASASKPSSSMIASVIGFATLLLGASSVAGELKASLNTIWDRPANSHGTVGMLKDRSKALGVVLGCGFLMVVSLAVTSAIAAAGSYVSEMLPLPEVLMAALMFVLSIAVLTGVFAVLFKYLPNVDIKWHDVIIGAVFTAVLFTIGEFLIGMYLGKASFGSTYGAAGSVIIVLVWVYYSAQIFFFGAEFTQVYAGQLGSDPNRKRHPSQLESRLAGETSVAPKSTEPEYAQTASGQTGGATATAGSLLGTALAIMKAVKVFRGKR
jgi:membrane protein